MRLQTEEMEPATSGTSMLEEAETRTWIEMARLWDDSEPSDQCGELRHRLRVPFLLAYRGPGGRERLVMATSKEVGDGWIKVLARDPLPPFQRVRIRPDLDGLQRAWVRGVTVESVQTVGCYEIYIEFVYRRSA